MKKGATSKDKLKELIVYVASKCADDANWGETKLNKILFFSDFYYYRKRRKAITGHAYARLPYGPVPNDMKAILKEMNGKDIAVAVSDSGPYTKNKVVALREADLSNFDGDMISLVDSVINQVCGKDTWTAKQLTASSHDTMGWIVTSNSDIIPYQTVFVKDKRYQIATAWEKIHAQELARQLTGQYGITAPNT